MSRTRRFGHRFITNAPAQLEMEVLYVSLEYATVLHLCACGCRGEVVTPLSPSGWSMVFDGASVALSPSIGNWSFPCRSHYWIASGGRVQWARTWSDREIALARRARIGLGARREPARGRGTRSAIGDWLRRMTGR